MRSPTRTFFVMLLVTVVAAGLAGWAGVQVGLGKAAGEADLDTVIHRDLQLTQQQEERIRVLEQEFIAQRDALQAEMRAANRELANAITQEHAYTPNARRAVARLHAAMSQLQERTVEHVLAMRAILTPGQAQEFDAKVAKALGVVGQ
jgi:Spy/CpxP family protein refolding chaperone